MAETMRFRRLFNGDNKLLDVGRNKIIIADMRDVLQKVVLAEPDAVQVSIGQVSVCFARSSFCPP